MERITEIRRTVDYEDNRFTSHSLKDFTLKEGEFELPINVKNAGTRFENAFQLVGLNPDDCVPIPAYKAHDAIEKEPNLIYVISVDYNLVKTIETAFFPLFSPAEKTVWDLLTNHAGAHIRDAEDNFIYGMVNKHWENFGHNITASDFKVISTRKAIRILQQQPKRTPGIGLRAWGTGSNAEVNVHISLNEETKPWNEVLHRIEDKGLSDIVSAINRKRQEIVYDPEI